MVMPWLDFILEGLRGTGIFSRFSTVHSEEALLAKKR